LVDFSSRFGIIVVRKVGNTGRQLRSKDDSNNAFRTADFDEYGAVI